MDVDDLRSELASRAEQMPPATSTAARMAAVRRRVRVRRQRLAGGVVGVAVLGVGVVALVPAVVDRDAAQVVEPATPTQTPSEEVPGALDLGSWPTRIDGNTLVADRVSDSASRSQTWSMTVPTLDLSVSVFCRPEPALSRHDARRGRPIVTLSVNGRSHFGVSCQDTGDLEDQRLVTDLDGKMMRRYGVRPDRPFTVTMSLRRDARPASKAQLGVGLYAQDGEVRKVAPGWSIPVIQGVPGDQTRLYEVFTTPASSSGVAGRITTQASTEAGSTMTYGWLVRGHRGTFEIVVDGNSVERSTAGALSSGTPIRGKHELVLRTRGGVDQGTLVLALYEPVEAPYTGSARR